MGGVPKRHKTHSKVRIKRATKKLKPKALTKCSHCGQWILPHTVCPFCGYYRGQKIIEIKIKTKKKK